MKDTLQEEFNKLESCIHCGMCLPTCPTYRVTGSEAESPRGRLYLMRQFLEGNLDNPKQLSDHLDPCLGCVACVTACPSGVQYGDLLMAAREDLVETQPKWKRELRRWLLQNLLPNPKRMQAMVFLTKLYVKSGIQKRVRQWNIPKLAGPLGKLEQFVPAFTEGSPIASGQTWGENRKGRVALFTGCIMNAVYHRTHQATIDVLVANGYQVYTPEQTCCGALAHHSGERDIAEAMAEENVFRLLRSDPDWIVINAAGCGSTLKEYQHILHHSQNSQIFTSKVVDILELLAKHDLEGDLSPMPFTVTYHAACHLHHAQKIQKEPYEVLKQIPDLKLIPLTEADMCCGSAGVYNLAHPDTSLEILDIKMGHLEKTHADVVLASNPGCMLQLETGIRQAGIEMNVMHPIELLAMAYQPAEPIQPSLKLIKNE